MAMTFPLPAQNYRFPAIISTMNILSIKQ